MNTDLTVPDESPVQMRREARWEELPEIYKLKTERMACELALGLETPETIFTAYGYSAEQAVALLESPSFTLILERIAKEVRESGLSFKMKARAQAEELLADSFDIATDPYQSAAVRADLIKWTAKMAGHEPKEKGDDGKSGGGLTLSITFAGQPTQAVVREALTIEQ